MKKKISMFMAVMMLISSISCCFSVVSSAVDENNDGTDKSIAELFSQDSTTFDIDLAIKSFYMAYSAFGVKDVLTYEETDDDAIAQFEDYGFDVTTYNYDVSADTDSAACAIGTQTVQINGVETTILAIAIRGGEYKNEWSGNFNIGYEDDHTGFSLAKDEVLMYLEQFLSDNEICDNVKVWISGFSRGGGIANLLAADLIGNLDEYANISSLDLSNQSIYAYTFEAPLCSTQENTKDAQYNYIFNMVNSTDIITKIAPLSFGFSRYGQDMFLPSAENTYDYYTYLPEVQEAFYEIDGSYYYGEFRTLTGLLDSDLVNSLPTSNLDFSEYTLGSFLDYYVNDVIVAERVFDSRDYYYEYLQGFLSLSFGSIFGHTTEYIEAYFEGINEDIKNYIESNAQTLSVEEFLNDETLSYEIETLIDSFTAYYADLTEEVFEETNNNIIGVVTFIGESLIYDLDYLLTLIVNIDSISYAHFPELTEAWLLNAKETGYFDDSLSTYKTIKISGSCDIKVYDSNDTLVAIFNNGYAGVISDSPIAYSVDRDGLKTIQLPMDEEFTIEIIATSNSSLTYSVQTIDMSSYSCIEEVSDTATVLGGDELIIVTNDATQGDGDTEVTFNQIGTGSEATCGCFCHNDDFISAFIFSVISNLWEIFNMNYYCDCGAYHY